MMTIEELMNLANDINVDCNKCITKSEYISTIVGDIQNEGDKAVPSQIPPVPPEDNITVEPWISEQTDTLKFKIGEVADFSEVGNIYSQMEMMFRTGKYTEVLELIQNAIHEGETSLKKFQGIGLSIAVLSSQELMDSVSIIGLEAEGAEKMLINAKKNLMNEKYTDASKSIRKIRDMTPSLLKYKRERLSEMIKSLESQIVDAKRIGADMRVAEQLIKGAYTSFENNMLDDCSKAVLETKNQVEEIKGDRISVINETINFVEKLKDDAKAIGADIAVPTEHLEKAKSLFEKNEFQMCMYSTIQAEEIITKQIQQQVEKAMMLQKSLEDRYKAVTTGVAYQEPEIKEALGELVPKKPKEMAVKITAQRPQKIPVDITTQRPEVKVKGPSEPKLSSTEELPPPCPDCGMAPDYIDIYKRWYCYDCKKYV